MSLGDEERILGVDGGAMAVKKITASFGVDKCPQLINKPKLFFLELRRADEDEKYYMGGMGGTLPPDDDDFLIAFSSTKGHRYPFHSRFKFSETKLSIKSLGSPFISCLMQILRANSHKQDLMTILTKVNKALSELYTHTADEDQRSQLISYQLSSLTKKVYFPNFH